MLIRKISACVSILSIFALKDLRAGILIKLTKSKEGKTKSEIIKGGISIGLNTNYDKYRMPC